MYDEVIKLLKKTGSTNIPGQGKKETFSEKELLAKVISIGQKEFYEAQANGLKPELKFEIADYLDYEDEKELIFGNRKYQILRIYRSGRTLEITVYGGVNHGIA